MVSFKRTQQIVKIMKKIVDVLTFPIFLIYLVCRPVYEWLQKHRKKYSYKAILSLAQYSIDFHLNREDCIYVVLDDRIGRDSTSYGCYGYNDLYGISSGGYGQHKKVRKKLQDVYAHQKDEYVKAVKELCGKPLTDEEKEKEFFSLGYGKGRSYIPEFYRGILHKEICKIENHSR